MANTPGHIITEIDVYKPNKALAAVMAGDDPRFTTFLLGLATRKSVMYQARVAQKTGRLRDSSTPTVIKGGHKHDRLVAKVSVAGALPASQWKGRPFYYGVLHNFGSPAKRDEFPAHNDLRAVMTVDG